MKPLWRGFLPALPPMLLQDMLRAGLGAGFGLLAADLLLWSLAGTAPLQTQVLLIAPFGASAFLIFAVPNSPLAQPWSAVVGNTVSALAGLAVLQFGLPTLPAVCLAVTLAVFVMAVARALHPPGGAVAIATILAAPAPVFAIFPVMSGTLALVVSGMVWAYLTGRHYPFRQPAAAPLQRQTPGPFELASAIGALRMGANLGVEDLSRLIATAEAIQTASNAGPATAQDLMTRDLVTLQTNDDPTHAVTLFRKYGHRHLPLLDGQAFVGLIPQTALLGASPPALTALVEPPATISPTTPLSDLLTRFAQGRDTCLAVTTRDRLVGLITRSDLLTAVMHGSPNRKDRP